jgi:hypothetical protein
LERNPVTGIAQEREVPMPKFRFETTAYGQTTAFEEELASADMASPRAIEKARAAMVADPGTEQSRSITRVYDEAGYLVATVNFSDVLPDDPDAAQDAIGEPPVEEPGVMRSG